MQDYIPKDLKQWTTFLLWVFWEWRLGRSKRGPKSSIEVLAMTIRLVVLSGYLLAKKTIERIKK